MSSPLYFLHLFLSQYIEGGRVVIERNDAPLISTKEFIMRTPTKQYFQMSVDAEKFFQTYKFTNVTRINEEVICPVGTALGFDRYFIDVAGMKPVLLGYCKDHQFLQFTDEQMNIIEDKLKSIFNPYEGSFAQEGLESAKAEGNIIYLFDDDQVDFKIA